MTSKAILAGLAALVAVAIPIRAEVGDLQPVACPAASALMARPLYAQAQNFAKAPEGCGTVNPHAVVATLRSGDLVIKVAIDSAKADAATPDVLRLDFSGAGKFADAAVVPLKMQPTGGDYVNASFGPTTVSIQRDGKAIPVSVEGSYNKSSTYRYLNMFLGTGMDGRCAFGDKTYPVRIVDGNHNLRFGDTPNVFQQGGRVRSRAGGPQLSADTLIVDTGEGFDQSKTKSFFGQPVLVDGAWYDVKLSEDASKISAKPSEAKTGTIQIPQKQWTAKFIGGKYVLVLSGTDKPVAVPADSYVIADYQITIPGQSGLPSAMLMAGRMALYGQEGKLVEVPEGQTVSIPIGPPLTGSIQASQSGRTVNFSLKLADAAGSSVDYLTLAGGRQPPEPHVEVFDKAGKSVYTGKMQYG